MYKPFKIMIVGLGMTLSLAAYSNPKTIKRDPTQPPAYENTYRSVVNEDVKITAIYAGGKNPKAIIGKHVFSIGDQISDSTIIAIDSDGITLKNNDGTTYRIVMNHTIVKTPTNNNSKEGRKYAD